MKIGLHYHFHLMLAYRYLNRQLHIEAANEIGESWHFYQADTGHLSQWGWGLAVYYVTVHVERAVPPVSVACAPLCVVSPTLSHHRGDLWQTTELEI